MGKFSTILKHRKEKLGVFISIRYRNIYQVFMVDTQFPKWLLHPSKLVAILELSPVIVVGVGSYPAATSLLRLPTQGRVTPAGRTIFWE